MAKKQAIFFLTAIILCAGCTGRKQQAHNVFYWNIAAGFNSLDPAFAKTQSNIWLVNQVFNTLVDLDDSLHIQPSLARGWNVSSDGLFYTFHLRNDVYFQDNSLFPGGKGRKMTAADVLYSFKRIVNPETASSGAWVFNDKVYKDSLTGQPGFYAPDDSTFIIRLIRPFRPFLQLLTLKYCSVVPHEIADYYGKDFRTHAVGTGPFQLKYYYEGEKIVLQRNPHYFEKDGKGHKLPYLDAVMVSFNPSKQDEFFSFAKGSLSLMSGLDPAFKDYLLTRDGTIKASFRHKFRFQLVPFLNTEYIGILVDSSLDKTPLRLKKVRQAINYAIDRPTMIRYLKNNTVDAGVEGFVPPSLLACGKQYYHYNPEKARRLLREAGYAKGITLSLATTSNYLDLAVYMQKELEDIGIKAAIENVPGSSLSDMKTQSKINFFRASWIADYADPENYLSVFYSKNWSPDGANYCHFKNAAYDSLYEKALATPKDTERNKIYCRMQDILMDEAPVVVLYYDKVVRLVSYHVHGLSPNPINFINLKKVWLD